MSPDLWSFALKTYALPGVQEACLQLQDGGANAVSYTHLTLPTNREG